MEVGTFEGRMARPNADWPGLRSVKPFKNVPSATVLSASTAELGVKTSPLLGRLALMAALLRLPSTFAEAASGTARSSRLSRNGRVGVGRRDGLLTAEEIRELRETEPGTD
jgi:hypothetical protein